MSFMQGATSAGIVTHGAIATRLGIGGTVTRQIANAAFLYARHDQKVASRWHTTSE